MWHQRIAGVVCPAGMGTILRVLCAVVCVFAVCGGGRAFASQDDTLPIKVADDSMCKLRVTQAELRDGGKLVFYYTLRNKSDEKIRLGHDDDWTCDGKSVSVVASDSVDAGDASEDYFFVKNVDPSGDLVVKGTLLIKDEDGDVAARHTFRFDDAEHVEGRSDIARYYRDTMPKSTVDGEEFVRLWCGNYDYEIGTRFPKPWSSDVRSGWLKEARSYVSRSSDLYSDIEDRYDDAFEGKTICAPTAKLVLTSGNMEKWEVEVRTVKEGWDDFDRVTEYWDVCYAKDGKVEFAEKSNINPKAK